MMLIHESDVFELWGEFKCAIFVHQHHINSLLLGDAVSRDATIVDISWYRSPKMITPALKIYAKQMFKLCECKNVFKKSAYDQLN